MIWLIKSDPESYNWAQMKKDTITIWDGVRNYQARNNLREMKAGEIALFYESNEGKCIVGEVKITKEAFQDPTTDNANWLAVEVMFLKEYNSAVTLAQMKNDDRLKDIGLITQSRLSVMKVTDLQYATILEYAK